MLLKTHGSRLNDFMAELIHRVYPVFSFPITFNFKGYGNFYKRIQFKILNSYLFYFPSWPTWSNATLLGHTVVFLHIKFLGLIFWMRDIRILKEKRNKLSVYDGAKQRQTDRVCG